MKPFIMLLLLASISSCAFKEDDQLLEPTIDRFNRQIVINPTDDLDFDGIKNEDEKLLGLDPLIADIPEVRVRQIKEVNTGVRIRSDFDGHSTSKFIGLSEDYIDPIDSESKESLVRRKILNLQYLKVTEPTRLPDPDEMATLSDYDLFIVGRWRDRDFYPFKHTVSNDELVYVLESGRITSTFKVELKNLKGISVVERVFLSTNLIDSNDNVITEFRTHPLLKSNNTEERFTLVDLEELKPVDNYFIYDINLESESISSLLLDRNNIALKVKNFTFKRLGSEFDFAQLVSQVEEKTARVIYSIGETTKTYQVTPGMSLETFIKHLGHNLVTDSKGNIISIDGVSNNLSTPIDLENIPTHELDNGLWHILGEGEKTTDVLVANKQYIVSYSTAREMISSQAIATSILEEVSIGTNSLEIPDARVGDLLEVSLSAKRIIPYVEHYTRSSRCSCEVLRIRRCGPIGDDGGDTCEYWAWDDGLYCDTVFKRINYQVHDFHLNAENLPVVFTFNGTPLLSKELVSEYDGIGIYNDSKNAGFRFLLEERFLKEDRFFSIQAKELPEVATFEIGYVSTGSSPNRRNCRSHENGTSTVTLKHRAKLNININRKGINR